MNATFPAFRLTAAALTAAISFLLASPASAQGRLKAQFTISMTGVSIGKIAWQVDIDDNRYVASANGKAGGVLSMLVSGEGSVVAHGAIADGRMVPTYFISRTNDDEGDSEVRMTFEDGSVKELTGTPPTPADRVPVTDADRRNVDDPLTAMLMLSKNADNLLAAANCTRMLPVFDGRRRYNLLLSYRRIDKFSTAKGAPVAVLVCNVVLQPVAGYRAGSMMVKYVAGRRDLELWFAPIAGTHFIAPIKVVMPTLLGTLEIAASEFDAVALPALPPSPPR